MRIEIIVLWYKYSLAKQSFTHYIWATYALLRDLHLQVNKSFNLCSQGKYSSTAFSFSSCYLLQMPWPHVSCRVVRLKINYTYFHWVFHNLQSCPFINSSNAGIKWWSDGWNSSPTRKGWERWGWSAWRRGDLQTTYTAWREPTRKLEGDFL